MSEALATRETTGVELPAPGTWTIDPGHSTVGAVARHLMVTKVRGRFARYAGTLHIAEQLEDSWVEVEIEARSIDTGEPKRDEHLRSPDFLDVENHPSLTFRSTKLVPTSEASFALTGDLTIRGVVRPVTLDVTYDGVSGDPWGGQRAGFTATTELDRETFGMTWNQALETGGVLVGKKLKVELEIQAVRQE